MAHVHKPVPIPSSLGVVLPPGVEAALLRVLAKRPEERFPRCTDFVRALAGSTYASIAAMPIVAPAPSASAAPSQPPTPPPALTPASEPSPFLSPSALVRPLERAPSTPATPAAVAATKPTMAATAPTVVETPARLPLAKSRPWWRRRRMLILPAAILIAFAVLNLPKQNAGVLSPSSEPTRSARQTPTPAATTAAPTPTPTPVRTVEPTPTFNYGHTPQTATQVTPGVYNGNLTTSGELDYFRFDARAGVQIVVEYKGSTLSGGAMALLIQTSSGVVNQLAEDTDNGNGAKISYTTTQVGVYFLRVRSTRGDTGAYSFGLMTTAR